jgi:hypothetical protein
MCTREVPAMNLKSRKVPKIWRTSGGTAPHVCGALLRQRRYISSRTQHRPIAGNPNRLPCCFFSLFNHTQPAALGEDCRRRTASLKCPIPNAIPRSPSSPLMSASRSRPPGDRSQHGSHETHFSLLDPASYASSLPLIRYAVRKATCSAENAQ